MNIFVIIVLRIINLTHTPTTPPPYKGDADDQVITVTLPAGEYKILRKMIERDIAMKWVGKWFQTFVFVLIGGIITILVFGEKILKIFSGGS
jgi:hypothetical protein